MSDAVPGTVPEFDALLKSGAAKGTWKLDPANSTVNFAVKHFWGAITVRGSFSEFSGTGAVDDGGKVSGRLVIAPSSLDTGNNKRDTHLHSKDFFDVDNHNEVVVAVHSARPTGQSSLKCIGTLEVAGYVEPIEFTATVEDASAHAFTLHAEFVVDRSKFDMTWSPMHISSMMAKANVIARFVRA